MQCKRCYICVTSLLMILIQNLIVKNLLLCVLESGSMNKKYVIWNVFLSNTVFIPSHIQTDHATRFCEFRALMQVLRLYFLILQPEHVRPNYNVCYYVGVTHRDLADTVTERRYQTLRRRRNTYQRPLLGRIAVLCTPCLNKCPTFGLL